MAGHATVRDLIGHAVHNGNEWYEPEDLGDMALAALSAAGFKIVTIAPPPDVFARLLARPFAHLPNTTL